MLFKHNKLAFALANISLLTLIACGDGTSTSASGGSGPVVVGPAVLQGTVATGSAVANAVVIVTNSGGKSACQESAINATDAGVYTCTLKNGETAPFFVLSTDPAGVTLPLVSVTNATPAAGTTQVLNVTPLTSVIAAQVGITPVALADGAPPPTDKLTDLSTITSQVVAQLAPVTTALKAPADYNPFTTPIAAATPSTAGNVADQVLDTVKVTKTASGQPALATTTSPTPVPLATSSTPGSTLSADGVASSADLFSATRQMAATLQACFALPTAQRVLSTNTNLTYSQGGPSVSKVASTCEAMPFAHSTNAAGIDYRHNGYAAGQHMYNALTLDKMTGSSFKVPQVMAFYQGPTTASGNDEAVLNILYNDADGNPGNIITVAQNIGGKWWLTGNQQPVEVTVKTLIRRFEQLNTASTNVGRYQTGLQIYVNAKGPGTVLPDNSTLNFARVSGPGLPSKGLVFIAPVAAEVGQTSMDLANKDGTVPAATRCGNSPTATTNLNYNCPNFWFARTAGLTGTDATTLAPNFNSLVWAQVADGADASKIVKGNKYKIELFYGSRTTPTYTYNKTLMNDMLPATQGGNLAWNSLGAQSKAALDPNNTSLNGVQPSLGVDWVQNIIAEQVGSVSATVYANGVWGTGQAVNKGDTSTVYQPSPSVPAFSATGTRGLMFTYRTLDNSSKNAQYQFN